MIELFREKLKNFIITKWKKKSFRKKVSIFEKKKRGQNPTMINALNDKAFILNCGVEV